MLVYMDLQLRCANPQWGYLAMKLDAVKLCQTVTGHIGQDSGPTGHDKRKPPLVSENDAL